MLIVELDGGQHAEQEERDQARTKFLNQKGFCVLRFWNDEVLKDTEAVLAVILEKLAPHPNPLPARGERGPCIEGQLNRWSLTTPTACM